MEITVSTDDLKKCSLFVATPMYGGMSHGLYVKSCLDLQNSCSQYSISTRFSFLFNESLITRARNYLVDEFLRTDATHLLFIDSDIHFNPQDVIALLALNRDVIGGPYPKKSINWSNIAEAARRHPSLEPRELENLAGEYVFNVVQGTEHFTVTEPLEVMEIGTGFMMIKREVFTRYEKEYPEYRYKPDHVGQAHFDGSRYIHAYFDTVIDAKRSFIVKEIEEFLKKNPDASKEDILEVISNEKTYFHSSYSDRYLSEDYSFCQNWRKIGGKIWLCPWMKTQHIGTYAFTGNLPRIAELTGRI